jgi:glyoxylase-like metal-dependent hydrolase (beta-lactamase superfamily II)
VIVTGDIFDTTSYPHFYPEYGGSLQGIIDALNLLIEIAIPEFNQQGGTLIIPGHGRLSSESDVVEYRDMLTIIRDRVEAMIDEGYSFEEVFAAQPSLEYNGIYGYESGEWTTRMFLEAVYEELL